MPAMKPVLVIDDDKTVSGLLRDVLESDGFEVWCCDNGPSALELSKERCFDVIVTDYRMPGINGDEVARVLRHLCPDAFIIGFSVGFQDRAFLQAGADVFVEKHNLFQELVPLIGNRMRHRQTV